MLYRGANDSTREKHRGGGAREREHAIRLHEDHRACVARAAHCVSAHQPRGASHHTPCGGAIEVCEERARRGTREKGETREEERERRVVKEGCERSRKYTYLHCSFVKYKWHSDPSVLTRRKNQFDGEEDDEEGEEGGDKDTNISNIDNKVQTESDNENYESENENFENENDNFNLDEDGGASGDELQRIQEGSDFK